jgi:hypothetical protein
MSKQTSRQATIYRTTSICRARLLYSTGASRGLIAYYGERIEEAIAAEQGEELTEGEQALLGLLKRKLRRELEKAA